MACEITFKATAVQLNNRQFYRLIDFGIEIADEIANIEERPFVERMKKLSSETFWPGRGIDIAPGLPRYSRTEVLEPRIP